MIGMCQKTPLYASRDIPVFYLRIWVRKLVNGATVLMCIHFHSGH